MSAATTTRYASIDVVFDATLPEASDLSLSLFGKDRFIEFVPLYTHFIWSSQLEAKNCNLSDVSIVAIWYDTHEWIPCHGNGERAQFSNGAMCMCWTYSYGDTIYVETQCSIPAFDRDIHQGRIGLHVIIHEALIAIKKYLLPAGASLADQQNSAVSISAKDQLSVGNSFKVICSCMNCEWLEPTQTQLFHKRGSRLVQLRFSTVIHAVNTYIHYKAKATYLDSGVYICHFNWPDGSVSQKQLDISVS